MRPAELIKRPSALSIDRSSSRSQIPSRPEALKGEPFASKSSKPLKEFALGMSSPVLFIDPWKRIANCTYLWDFDCCSSMRPWSHPTREHWHHQSYHLFLPIL